MSEETGVRMTISYSLENGHFYRRIIESASVEEAITRKGEFPSPETHWGFISTMEGKRTHQIDGENVIKLIQL